LASASERRYVEALAARIGLAEPVFATDQGCNLSGPRKRDALVAAFGEGGFDYIGDSRTDRPVWQAARRSYVMRSAFGDPTRGLATGGRTPEMVMRSGSTPRTLVSALRIHQWVKNLLVFVPLILGGAIGDSSAVLKALSCFVAFCVLASSTYLINDLLDVANDRRHPSKRHRPLASGALHPVPAVGLALLGVLIGLSIGAATSWPVLFGLAGYVALTLAYSLRLKRVPIVDAVTLGGLYTWRLFVGVLAAGVTFSAWLMVFSFTFFLSLALAKRQAEITNMITANRTELAGRGYRTCDAPFVMNMGVAAGVSSILIFILYLIEGAFRAAYFSAPTVLWVCPAILLLWISRVWMLAGRGELHEDPVEFAIRDPKSAILAAIAAAAILMAMLA
jgi:4-hydroxybenzoate polyprenyltransferase